MLFWNTVCGMHLIPPTAEPDVAILASINTSYMQKVTGSQASKLRSACDWGYWPTATRLECVSSCHISIHINTWINKPVLKNVTTSRQLKYMQNQQTANTLQQELQQLDISSFITSMTKGHVIFIGHRKRHTNNYCYWNTLQKK